MKRTLSLLLVLAMALTLLPMATTAYDAGTVSLVTDANANGVSHGETITVSVCSGTIENAAALSITVSFDNTVFEVVEGSITPNASLPNVGIIDKTAADRDGVLTASYAYIMGPQLGTAIPITDGTTFLTAQLRVKGDASVGTTAIRLTDFTADPAIGPTIPVSQTVGTLNIMVAGTVTTVNDLTINAPAKSAEPQTDLGLTGSEPYTASAISWYEGTSTTPYTGNSFAPSTVYRAQVVLTAKTGYTFPATTAATVNNNSATATVGDNGTTLTVSYTFPATESRTVTGITITQNPTQTIYNRGDSFNPVGMVVTATYDVGPEAAITDYVVTPRTIAAETTSVTISYGSFNATVPISVRGILTALDFNTNIPSAAVKYDGDPVEISATCELSGGPSTVAISYQTGDSGTLTTEAPTAAGTYTVYATFNQNDYYEGASNLRLGTFTIEPKSISVSGITAVSKEYDGNVSAALVTTGMRVNDMDDVNTPTINLPITGLTIGATGSFDDSDPNDTINDAPYAGTDKPVSITLTLSGVNSGNYRLYENPISAMADITAAPQTLSANDMQTVIERTITATEILSNITGAANSDAVTYSLTDSGDTYGTIDANGDYIAPTAAVTATIVYSASAVDLNNDGINEYDASIQGSFSIIVSEKTSVDSLINFPDGNSTYTGSGQRHETANITGITQDGSYQLQYTYGIDTEASNNTNAALDGSGLPLNAGHYVVTATYEDDSQLGIATAKFEIRAANLSTATVTLGNALTYNGQEQTQGVSSVTLSGFGTLTQGTDYVVSNATQTNASQTYALQIDGRGNFTGVVTRGFTIARAPLTLTGVTFTSRGYISNNTSVVVESVTFSGIQGNDNLSEGASADYTVTGSMQNANAGTKSATAYVTLTNTNYSLADPDIVGTVVINKAPAPTLRSQNVSYRYNDQTQKSVPLNPGNMPNDAGSREYSIYDTQDTVSIIDIGPTISESNIEFNLSGTRNPEEFCTITVGVETTNYENATFSFIITLTDKLEQNPLVINSASTVVYGQSLGLSATGGSGNGAITYAVTGGTGSATISGNVLTATGVGTIQVTATKAEDDNYNSITSSPVTITITKADPTGQPSYTTFSNSGHTLDEASLSLGTLSPDDLGYTLTWIDEDGNVLPDDTVIENGASYTWCFTPADTTNYNTLTGDVVLYTQGEQGSVSTTKYTVSFESNGGSRIDDVRVNSGNRLNLTLNRYTPVREGYVFAGWYDNRSLNGKSLDSIRVVEDITLYASWVERQVVPVPEILSIPATTHFSDVGADDWFYGDVMSMYQQGLMNGVSSTAFDPYGQTTRAMVVTILYRIDGSPAVTGSTGFNDVNTGEYYYNAVLWAENNEIAQGYTDGGFHPNEVVTRQQLAAFLYRFAQYRGYSTTGGASLDGFVDQPDTWAEEAVRWAVGNGIITGKGNGVLDPTGSATRAELAAMINRFMNNFVALETQISLILSEQR